MDGTKNLPTGRPESCKEEINVQCSLTHIEKEIEILKKLPIG